MKEHIKPCPAMLTAEIDSKFKVKGARTDGIVDVNLVLLWWQGSNYLDFLHWNTIPSILCTCIFIGIISGSCKGGDWSNQNAVSLYFSSQRSNWCSCVTCFKHAEHSQKLKDRSCYFLLTKKKKIAEGYILCEALSFCKEQKKPAQLHRIHLCLLRFYCGYLVTHFT